MTTKAHENCQGMKSMSIGFILITTVFVFQNECQHVASSCHGSLTFLPRFAAADFRAVSLGPRILRSEVATVAALAGDHRVGNSTEWAWSCVVPNHNMS